MSAVISQNMNCDIVFLSYIYSQQTRDHCSSDLQTRKVKFIISEHNLALRVGMSIGHIVHGRPMSKSIWTNMVTPKYARNISVQIDYAQMRPESNGQNQIDMGCPNTLIFKKKYLKSQIFGEKEKEGEKEGGGKKKKK